jgi:hypothetical protein
VGELVGAGCISSSCLILLETSFPESSVPQGMKIFPHMPAKFVGLHWHRMAVTVEMQNTGDPALQREVVATIEHVLSDRPGDWRVSIIGSQANDKWEMKIIGPNAFERSYTLEGTAGEHRPESLLGKLVPR